MPSLGILLLIACPYLVGFIHMGPTPTRSKTAEVLAIVGRTGYLYDVPIETDEACEGLFNFADDETDLGGETVLQVVLTTPRINSVKLAGYCSRWLIILLLLWYRLFLGSYSVTVHESRVTSVQKRMEPRRSLLGASVDVTDARNTPVIPNSHIGIINAPPR